MKKLFFIISFFLFIPTCFAVDTVETVPNADIFVQLDMFDYDVEDSSTNHPDNIINTKFNTLSPLKFYGIGANNDATPETGANPDRFTLSDAVRQGMVERKLNDEGFPVLANSHESLNILFDNTEQQYKKNYYNIKSLFVKKRSGFYYFNSDEFYAEYDHENNDMKLITPTFKLKNSLQSEEDEILYTGFFPFDTYNPEKDDVNPSMNLQDTDMGYDHHFGMHIKSKIFLPKDYLIDGQEMKFNFTGDDDIWVFIDGVLVLDLGGIHYPATGTINLTTAEVYTANVYDGNNDSVNPVTQHLNYIFQMADKEFDWSENSEHQMDIFYLERGGVFSNLKIETNFWQPKEPDPEPEEPEPEPEEPEPDPLNDNDDVDSSQTTNPKTSNDNIVISIVIVSTVVFLIAFYVTDKRLIIKKNSK